MSNWIVVAQGLTPTQLNSTRLSGSGAGPLLLRGTTVCTSLDILVCIYVYISNIKIHVSIPIIYRNIYTYFHINFATLALSWCLKKTSVLISSLVLRVPTDD